MDKDGYPDEHELKVIREWPYEDGWRELLRYVQQLWRWDHYFTNKGRFYSISTGGWSGNESLIGALVENQVFWNMCWVSSRRGGHYKFEIRKLKESKNKT